MNPQHPDDIALAAAIRKDAHFQVRTRESVEKLRRAEEANNTLLTERVEHGISFFELCLRVAKRKYGPLGRGAARETLEKCVFMVDGIGYQILHDVPTDPAYQGKPCARVVRVDVENL